MRPGRSTKRESWVSLQILMLLVLVAILVAGALPTLGLLGTRLDTISETYSEKPSNEPSQNVSALPNDGVLFKGNEMARVDGSRVKTASKVSKAGNSRSTRSLGGSFGTAPTSRTARSSELGLGGQFNSQAPMPTPSAPITSPSAPAPRIAPPSAAPAPRAGSGYGGGSVGTMSTGVIAEAAPAPPIDMNAFVQGGYAGQDSAFVAEDAAAESELQNLLQQLARQNSEYETGFKGNLRSLGLDWEGDDWKGGQWDQTDTLGAYGQSYQNLQNDYSGRGMMDSTFYGNAQRDMTDRFNRQRDEAISGLETQRGNSAQAQAQAQTAREQAKQRALAEAYARFVSGFSI